MASLMHCKGGFGTREAAPRTSSYGGSCGSLDACRNLDAVATTLQWYHNREGGAAVEGEGEEGEEVVPGEIRRYDGHRRKETPSWRDGQGTGDKARRQGHGGSG